MRRTWPVSIMVALVAAVVLVPAPAAAAPGDRQWLALGDSFSSGEGVSGTAKPRAGEQECARASGEGTDASAWAVGAYRQVREEKGLTGLAFVACTGAINDDLRDQIDEAAELGVPDRRSWDVVSFSSGGNNVGFVPILTGCLDALEPRQWGVLATSPGCDVSEQEIRRRIDVLAEAVPFDSEGLDGTTTWPDLYDDVAEVVEPGGDVVVVGYPNVLEDPAKFPIWRATSRTCEGIQVADIPMLRRVTDHLNRSIRDAVAAADARHAADGVRFHFVDIARDPYETGDRLEDRHGLCSVDPWLNGVTVGFTSGDARYQRSFHPKQRGHDATARVVAGVVREFVRFDDAPAPTGAVLDRVDWESVVQGRVDCSGIDLDGLVELDGDPARFDVNGDGALDAVVGYRCRTGDSSSFSQQEVFDGASPPGGTPRSLGTVLAAPTASTWEQARMTGMKVYSVAMEDGAVVVRGSMYAADDPNACPSLDGVVRSRWDGTRFVSDPVDIGAGSGC